MRPVPLPSPDDPIIAAVVYGIVLFALSIVLSGSRKGQDRTIRLFFFYLTYVLFEVVAKRATHYAWYIYPLKYGLFVLVLNSWLSGRRHGAADRQRPPLRGVLQAYLVLAAIQIFNPYQFNPVVGMLGWLSDFMYVSLYFVAFDLMTDLELVRRFFWLTTGLGILSAVGCFVEQWIGPDLLMQKYPMFVQLAYFTEFGIKYRPFSLSGFMEIFAIAMMLVLLDGAKEKGKLILVFSIVACAIANVLHAIRIMWATGLLFVAMFTVLNWKRSMLHAVVVPISIMVAIRVGINMTEGAVSSNLETVTRPIETIQQARFGGLLAMRDVVIQYPLGVGVGEASAGLRFVDSPDIIKFGTHNYLTELAAQMSVAGPFLLLLFCSGVLRCGLGGLYQARDGGLRTYMAGMLALFGAITASFLIGGALGSYPSSEYFWFLAGALMRLVQKSPDQYDDVSRSFRGTSLSIKGRAGVRGGPLVRKEVIALST